MSVRELNAHNLIRLGEDILILLNPDGYDLNAYRESADRFISIATKAGFDACIPAASDINQRVKDLVLPSQFVPHQNHCKSTAIAIDLTLCKLASNTTIILTDSVPPTQLSQLKNLQPDQDRLLHDLTICIKGHLARPAIVMAWALGYDIVRHWVFDDVMRRGDFNKHSKVGQIHDYKDVYLIGERDFLNTVWKAQDSLKGFNENTHRRLVDLLDDRNRFAHANDKVASTSRANVFVEEMVEIVTGPPFNI